MFYGK